MRGVNKIHKVVFVRHGESLWNKANRFSGWVDVPLNQKGVNEAILAGQRLKNAGFTFDIAYTSMLKRAICTYNHIGCVRYVKIESFLCRCAWS